MDTLLTRGRRVVITALCSTLVLLTAPGASTQAFPVQLELRERPAGGWEWPVGSRPAVLRHFDRPPQRWMAGHRGVDLAATADAAVRSPADGVVVFLGTVVDRPVLTIDHGDGLLSSFEPVDSPLAKGTAVQAGEEIGSLSEEPHCPETCLHWGVRENGEYVNPLQFVSDLRPSVLLPFAST